MLIPGVSSIINLDFPDDTGTLDQSFPFLVIQLTGTGASGHPRWIPGKHTIDQLLLTHFQTEYGYRQILLKCHMLRDIQYKRRLTHGRTGCDQHQVRGLHSGGTMIVQINESGGNTCDGSVQFGSLLDLVHGVHDYGTNRYEFLDVFLLYHFIDLALGTLQNRIQALLAAITGIGNLFIGTDQTPEVAFSATIPA